MRSTRTSAAWAALALTTSLLGVTIGSAQTPETTPGANDSEHRDHARPALTAAVDVVSSDVVNPRPLSPSNSSH